MKRCLISLFFFISALIAFPQGHISLLNLVVHLRFKEVVFTM